MRRLIQILPVVALVALSTGVARAESMLGAEVFGAFNTYKMDDMNNSNFGGQDIHNGVAGGIGGRMWMSQGVLLQATWEPLFAETNGTFGKVNVDANSYQLGLGLFMPSMTSSKFGVDAGAGWYSVNGKVTNGPFAGDLKGSGPGFHVLGMAEFMVSPGFSVTGGAGYRFAKIDLDNSSSTADYSGFTGRLGVAFYMPTASTHY